MAIFNSKLFVYQGVPQKSEVSAVSLPWPSTAASVSHIGNHWRSSCQRCQRCQRHRWGGVLMRWKGQHWQGPGDGWNGELRHGKQGREVRWKDLKNSRLETSTNAIVIVFLLAIQEKQHVSMGKLIHVYSLYNIDTH